LTKEDKGRTVILVSEHCPSCRVLEKKLEDKIKSGEIEVLKIETEEGLGFARLMNIMEVPTVISLTEDKTKKALTVCKLNEDLSPEECVEVEAERSE